MKILFVSLMAMLNFHHGKIYIYIYIYIYCVYIYIYICCHAENTFSVCVCVCIHFIVMFVNQGNSSVSEELEMKHEM